MQHRPIFYRFPDITTYWSEISVIRRIHLPTQSRLKPSQGGGVPLG